MKKTLKTLVAGFAVGVVLGLWFGVNIGKGQPFYSNPFEEVSVTERLRQKGGEMLQKGGQAIEKTGEKLQDKVE
jgi:hypothetical protein